MIYAFIVLVGTAIAGFINWAIYSWAWSARAISPWSAPPPGAAGRTLVDRIPIVGWLGLRREREFHVKRQREILRRFEPAGVHVKVEEPKIYSVFFWLRPLLIELSFGPALAFLYWWEVENFGLIDPVALAGVPAAAMASLQQWMQILFLSHAVLLTLLVIATFIDFDEQTIPDSITISGTLIALASAAVLPMVNIGVSCLPWSKPTGAIVPLLFCSPLPLDPWWFGAGGLIVAEGIVAAWCFGLANRRWIMRHGLGKAFSYFFAGLFKHDMLLLGLWKTKVWIFLTGLWILLSGAVGLAFWYAPPPVWIALLSAIIGLGIGGGQIWAVRIVARMGLGKEAMGFGDVTLMAMVGAFLGWQAALFTFFLAPFTAMVIVLISWLLTGNRMLPFGPYLAAGSMLTVVFWDPIWNQWASHHFVAMPLIGAVGGLALVTMCAMLFAIRIVENVLLGLRQR